MDFVWVEFTLSLDLVDLVTDPSLEVTWMKCKTYSSLTLDVRPAIILCNDIALIHNVVIVSLCRNPDGFLWAGDTAQTIYIRSTFSFKELGAFVYRYQVRDYEVRYEKLIVSSEIDPSSAWYPESPQGFSVARELLLSWRYCQLCQRHNPATTTVPGCNRCSATGSRCHRKWIASIFP